MISRGASALTLTVLTVLSGCGTGYPNAAQRILDWGVPVPASYTKEYNVKDNSTGEEEKNEEAKYEGRCITEWYGLERTSLPFKYVGVVAPAFVSKDAGISQETVGLLGALVFLLVQREGRKNMEVYVEACKHKYANKSPSNRLEMEVNVRTNQQ